jgi:hypothetical protein
VSRARGLALQNALARYLAAWWPSAESAGAGRPGSDVLGTPGIVWENKTGAEFRIWEWAVQARGHVRNGELPVTVYWPRAVGERRPELAMAILPLPELVTLLTNAGRLEGSR